MNVSLMLDSLPELIHAAILTIELLFLTLILGGLLALPLGLAAAKAPSLIRLMIAGYIAFFRGTPLLVQIFLVYYGFSQFPWVRASFLWVFLREAWFCTLFTLSLHTAAYTANIVRGAIQSVPLGSIEAAKACGLKKWRIYRHIILPQALRIALPAYSNETISMMKATSLASTVTLMDLTGMAKTIVSRTYAPYEIFITAAVLYLTIAWCLARLVRLSEARLSRHMVRPATARNASSHSHEKGITAHV